MTRIAHLADLHLGFSHLSPRDRSGRNQRQKDFERAALQAAKRIVESAPDVCVVAGDLLHETNLYPAALSGAVEFSETITAAGIPLLVIGGNHDEAEASGRYNALRFLAAHHGVDLHLEQTHRDIAGVRFHLRSFRVLSRAARGGELMPFEFSTELPNVLVTHGYASGEGVPDIPEDLETQIPEEWLSEPRFAAALLGHIHHHGEIRPHVFYAGSTERRNFGEVAERPGFWLHDLGPDGSLSSESVWIDELGEPLTPRPMLEFEIDTSELRTAEVSQKVLDLIGSEEVEGAMMRIVLYNVSAELDRTRARGDWEKAFRRRGGFSFEAVTRTRRLTELLDVEFSAPPADVAQGLLDFIAAAPNSNKQERERVLALAGEVIAEARDRVLAQESDG